MFSGITREYNDITRDIEPYATKYLADGSYVIAGRQRSNTNTQYDGMVMKLSAGAGVQWSISVGGLQEDNIMLLMLNRRSGIIISIIQNIILNWRN